MDIPNMVLNPVNPKVIKEPKIIKTNTIPNDLIFSDFNAINFIHLYIVFIVNRS